MNRNDEYNMLLERLKEMPPALEYTAQRATARIRRRRRTARFIGIPVGTLLGCLAGFVLMVNLVPTFAYACGRVDGLRELAMAVAWSPSLSAAVENEYVQPMEQTQSENGFTATVQYVIVDRKRLNIYYTLDFKPREDSVYVDYDFGGLTGISGTSGSGMIQNGEINEISLDFQEQVPSAMELAMTVYSWSPWKENSLAEMSFSLEFDPYFTAQGKIVPVGKEFLLDGQKFCLTEVEVYPTHLRIQLEDDVENTAWLKGLELYLENEHGERFEPTTNGITAMGDTDGEGYATFWLDSTYFSRGEHLTLYITEVEWLDKENNRIWIDLQNQTAEDLPEGTRFLGAEKQGRDWHLWFALERQSDGAMYSILSGRYWDASGELHTMMGRSHTFGVLDPVTGRRTQEDTMFTEEAALEDYRDDIVWLEPAFQRVSIFDEPVEITIK